MTVDVTLIKEGCKHCAVTFCAGTVVVMVPRRFGLGDVVRDIIHALTQITPCAGCERRRQWLNRKMPFIGPVMRALIERASGDTFPLHVRVTSKEFMDMLIELKGDK